MAPLTVKLGPEEQRLHSVPEKIQKNKNISRGELDHFSPCVFTVIQIRKLLLNNSLGKYIECLCNEDLSKILGMIWYKFKKNPKQTEKCEKFLNNHTYQDSDKKDENSMAT